MCIENNFRLKCIVRNMMLNLTYRMNMNEYGYEYNYRLYTILLAENRTCDEDMFTCKDVAQCIPTRWLCDQDTDCLDGSDEANCSKLLHASL